MVLKILLTIPAVCFLVAHITAEHSFALETTRHEISIEDTHFGQRQAILDFRDNFGKWHKIWKMQHSLQNHDEKYYIQPAMYLLVDTLKCKRSNTFLPSQIVFDVQLWNDDVATAASNALLRKRGAEVSPDDIQLIPISKMLLRLKSNYASMNGHRVSTDNDMITLSNYRRDDQQFSLNIDSDDTCEMAAAYFHSDPERLKKMVTIEVQLSFVHATSRTITVNQKHVTNGTLYRILHNMNPTDGLRWLSASDLTLFAQKITIDVMSTEVVEPYYYISESEQLIMEKNIEQSISQAENSRSVSVNWDLVYWPTDRVRPDRALDYLKFMFHYDENVDLFTMNPGDPSNQVEDLEEYNKMRCAIKVTLNKVFQLRKSYINDAEGIDADTFSTDTLTPEFVPPTDSSIHIITTIQPRLPSSQRYNLTKKNINYVLNQSGISVEWNDIMQQFAIASFDLYIVDLLSLSAASNIITTKVKMIPAIIRDVLNIIIPSSNGNASLNTLTTQKDQVIEMGADVTALNELKAETVTNSNQLPVQLNTVRDRPTVLLIAHDNKILKKGVSPPTPIEEILAMGTRYNIYDVTFDCKQERIFWSAYNGSHEGEIWTSLFNGTDRKLMRRVSMQSYNSILYDLSSRNMYYSNGWGGIEVVSIDENFNKTLIEKGGLLLLYHSHLALDLKNKHLFYSARHIIWRMDLDGSNRMQFVYSNVSYPNGLVVLHQGRKLCWLDHGRRELSCIGLDQRNRRVVYDNIQASPSCMTALNEKRFYWTTFTEKKVHSVSISGEGYTTFEVQNARLIHDVKDMTENCLSVETECAVNNGGCPHMCLPKTDGGVSCF